MMVKIPQADPGSGYRAHKEAIDAAIQRVLDSNRFILGQEGHEFEKEFAAYIEAGHAVSCGNGTDALVLALRGLDIGPGSTVVTVSHTAVATVAAIEMTGAVPLLIDVDPRHFTLDPAELTEVLSRPPSGLPPIRAVICVHLYGQAADMDLILPICRQHEVALVEDCAQAHGGRYQGRRLGTFGEAGTFSFYPTKNLGALGDGGAVVTRDAALAERLTALRQYGWYEHYVSREPGINSRLDEVQAAVLRAKLPFLDVDNQRRRAIAAAYGMALVGSDLIVPSVRTASEHAFHLYVARVPDGRRDVVRAQLREGQIGTGVHYPLPAHLQPAYAGRVAVGPSGCAVSARLAGEVLSLPLYPQLSDSPGAVCV
jgi:dTDP-4-amino-4,6-dideoxygalactose transaminase